MKLVMLADVHADNRNLSVPDGDVLIVAGDITHLGSFAEFKGQSAWLRTLPHLHKLVVPGNHDICCENLMNRNLESRLREFLHPIVYLRDSVCEIDGLRFYGTPWVLPWAGAFNLPSDELKRKWDAIPSDVDVLVTHQPPAGILDTGRGCTDLRKRTEQLPQLRVHVFGHIHEASGIVKQNHTTFVNASQQILSVEL